MIVHEHPPRTRYSCQEAHEDSELVLSNRATVAVRELYDEHLRTCRNCRRMHRALYSVYEGPAVPTPPVGVREEKEFHAILRRMKDERPESWTHRFGVRFAMGVPTTTIAKSAAIAGKTATTRIAVDHPTTR
jgi:hypothetical protein